MRYRILELLRYSMHATDGDLGTIDDVYFDDEQWTIRYLVVKTGHWLSEKRVLISPSSIVGVVDTRHRKLSAKLTRKMIEDSPDISAHKTVSRREQEKLHYYYNWPIYWQSELDYSFIPDLGDKMLDNFDSPLREDVHLRSAREVNGYHIEASDGEIGHIEDFLADFSTFKITNLVIDTKNWIPAKKVLISPSLVRSVNWSENKIYVTTTRDKVKNSPVYHPHRESDIEYELKLIEYYQSHKVLERPF